MTCHIWTPLPQAISDADLLQQVESMTYAGIPPLDQSMVAMLGGISQAILRHPQAGIVPQYVALGFWLRPAALKRMIKNWETAAQQPGLILAPRGVALHLPPTNVDTIFAYSWALSALAGNANIVRLSENLPPATHWLVELIAKTVDAHGESRRQIFVNFPYGGSLEKAVSRQCDLRLIWGGDAKVENVSKIAIRPDGLSIGFPDRRSLALIKSTSYAKAEEAIRDALANQLYNDIYWFDQMGCGSPRLLIWIGDKGNLAQDLLTRLQRVIATKGLKLDTGVAISKMVHANDLLAEGLAHSVSYEKNELTVAQGPHLAALLERAHGGGFIAEAELPDVTAVAPIISRKVQSLTHFGFSPEELMILGGSLTGRGGYRLIPIGQALQFDNHWDGIDLFGHFTRRLLIRQGTA